MAMTSGASSVVVHSMPMAIYPSGGTAFQAYRERAPRAKCHTCLNFTAEQRSNGID